MSSYYVIEFTREDIDENLDIWFNISFEGVLLDTKERLLSDPLREHEAIHVDVRLYRDSVSLPTIAEFETYSQVYFLNDGAMRLCRNAALDIKVLKTVSEEYLPGGLIICFQGPYLPADQ